MADQIYISEPRALAILMGDGDFTEGQARIVLMHSRKQTYEGQIMYPATYISNRAAENAAREEF